MHGGDYGHRNPFPHDGEGKHPCTGYGCDCDERKYGFHGGGSNGGGGSGGGIFIAMIVAAIVAYGVNELLGTIIMIGVIVYIAFR